MAHEGGTQLRQHVHIRWADISRHIASWKKSRPGDWKAYFDNFPIECHDQNHDKRCSDTELPTGPRARLQDAAYDKDRVFPQLGVATPQWHCRFYSGTG